MFHVKVGKNIEDFELQDNKWLKRIFGYLMREIVELVQVILAYNLNSKKHSQTPNSMNIKWRLL